MTWRLSSSSDPVALSIVDGTGQWAEYGPHYSRRTPGSKTFTGVGQEVVLVTESEDAVWAVVRQKTPMRKGSGASRGRTSTTDAKARYVWRNMMFRNLGSTLSSTLIEIATEMTYLFWLERYDELPTEDLRTEIDASKIKSSNPGYCYLMAGWKHDRWVRTKRYLVAPR